MGSVSYPPVRDPNEAGSMHPDSKHCFIQQDDIKGPEKLLYPIKNILLCFLKIRKTLIINLLCWSVCKHKIHSVHKNEQTDLGRWLWFNFPMKSLKYPHKAFDYWLQYRYWQRKTFLKINDLSDITWYLVVRYYFYRVPFENRSSALGACYSLQQVYGTSVSSMVLRK